MICHNNKSVELNHLSSGVFTTTGINSKTVTFSSETTYLKSINQFRLLLLKRQIPHMLACNLRDISVCAIGNLCKESEENCRIAGSELNAISMLLRCAVKVDADKQSIVCSVISKFHIFF